MNQAQQARADGFSAALAVRGINLLLAPSNVPVRGIIEPDTIGPGEYSLNRDSATWARLHFLRTHLAGRTVKVGSVFRDTANGASYRVTPGPDDLSSSIAVFICEASPS